jgi:hypothetical protein
MRFQRVCRLLFTNGHLLTHNSLSDIDKHCLEEFRKHWSCLDNNNQQLWQCRRYERPLNKCVFDNLVRHIHSLKCWIPISNHNRCTEVGQDHSRNPGKRASSPRAQETNIRSPQDSDLSSSSHLYDTTIPNSFSNAHIHDAYSRLALTKSPICSYQKNKPNVLNTRR